MNYVHLGGDVVVSSEDILAVFDLDNASYSHLTRKFLKKAQQDERIVTATEDLPRSFILCRSDQGGSVILSGLNAATLLKRAESGIGE